MDSTIPEDSMRRPIVSTLTALLVIATSLTATAAPASAHHGPELDGLYRYTDIVDGSNLTLWIWGGTSELAVYDDAASVCRDAGLGFVPAFHHGKMTSTGVQTWDVTGDLWCQTPRGWVVVIDGLTISYKSIDDGHALIDHTGQPYKYQPR